MTQASPNINPTRFERYRTMIPIMVSESYTTIPRLSQNYSFVSSLPQTVAPKGTGR